MEQPAEPTAPPTEEVPVARMWINEDWAATVIGLVLLLLVLAGVIVKGMVP